MANLNATFSAAKTNPRTVECAVCGAYVMPFANRVGTHNEQKVRAVRNDNGTPIRDHLGRPVTEVYVGNAQCSGSQQPPAQLDGTT